MSKKLKVVITIIALCLGLFFVGTKAYATTGKSINETTRIRKKANTNSEVVGTLDKNEKVEILSEEDGWYKVNYRNIVTGYIRNDLLQVDEEKKQEEDKTEKVEETKTENKEENKTESVEEAKTENEEENKTENLEEIETNNEVKEETNSENILAENTEIELKADMEIQLLPVIFSCKTGKISANTKVTVIEVVGNWARIESDELEGWIPTSKIQSNEVSENKDNAKTEEKEEEPKKEEKSENKKMYVSTVTLNLREKADTDSKILTQLNQNDEVTVVKVVDNTWSKVEFKNYEGYTASKYLSEKKVKDTTSRSAQEIRNAEEAKKKAEEAAKKKEEEEAKKKAEEEAKKKAEQEAKKKAEEEAKKKAEQEAKKKAEESKKTTSTKTKSSSKKSSKTTGADIVAYAKKFLGCRYVYGTAGPKTFDCSGLTSYVYKHFGYSLNRTSGGQRSNGKNVKKSDLEPGDILCFTGHVGIYIGGNKFIHAANPRKGVIISSLSESYYVKNYITARRIL